MSLFKSSALIALLAVGMTGCASFGGKVPLGAPCGPHDVWVGHGPVKTASADGEWTAVELTSRVIRRGGWVLGPYMAWTDNSGDAGHVPIAPSLKLGRETSYRWTGDELKYGGVAQRWIINPYGGASRLDTFRADRFDGEDNGSTPFYRQTTKFAGWETYISFSWFQHTQTWFPQRDIWGIWREETSSHKDSFSLGKRAHDPADSQSRWALGIMQDFWQLRRGNPYQGASTRFAVGGGCEFDHYWADDSNRTILELRLRWTKRWANQQQLTFDIVPMKNVGETNFEGLMFGLSYSFGGGK